MRLRPDVELELSETEGKLYDPLFERRMTLGAVLADVVRRLDGAHSPDQLAEASGRPRDQIDDALRTLLHLKLIDGSGGEVQARAQNLKNGNARLGRIVLAESRFGCQGSGDCCQSYHFGPLTNEDIARLDGLAIKDAFPALEAPYYYEREMPGSTQTGRFLRSVENRCLFLLDDCRCGLHAKFGYASKPGLCRYYPFEQFATLDGVQLYDKGGCSRFAITARSGAPLTEQLAEIGPLMPAAPLVHHPVILLDASTPVDFGYLQPLLRVAVDELEKPPAGAPEMLRAFARRTEGITQALKTCALSPEGPEQAVAELVARGPAPYLAPAPPEAVRAGAAALGQVVRALARAVTVIISYDHQQSTELYSGRQSKELIPILHLVEEVAAHLADPGFALSDYAREVAEIVLDDRDVEDVLRLSLRNQLFGHDALLEDRVRPAQLRLAMVQIIATWGARLSAIADGRKRVVAEDLSRAHMLAMRVPSWMTVKRVCLEEEAQLSPFVEALPELVRWTAAS
jgi:Fe-S-cluster containining protein